MDNQTQLTSPTTAQVLLGLFVCWQLIYLVGGNLVGMTVDGRQDTDELTEGPYLPKSNAGPIRSRDAIDLLAHLSVRYGELTGQPQRWSLFAPLVPEQGVFLTAEFRWPDGTTARQHSRFEPAVLPHLALDFWNDRLYSYDARLSLLAAVWDEAAIAREPDSWPQWRRENLDRVRLQWKSLRAYMRWRLREWQRLHPDRPPTEVVLLARVYKIPQPGQPCIWGEPTELPLARWRPGATESEEYLPVEVYDLLGEQFRRLPREGESPHE